MGYGAVAIDLAPLPDVLLDLLFNESRSTASDRVHSEATGAVPEGQRNDTLYRRGRALRAQGLSPAAIHAALEAENQAGCLPPLTQGEVYTIAEQAITQPDRPDFQATRTDDPHDAEPARPLGMGLGEFLGREFSPNEHLIEEILSDDDGGGWIAGEEKLGKTFYALEEALCLALGLPVCGRFKVPHRQRVLLIEEEDSPRRTHGRLRALLRGHGLDPDDLAVREDLSDWFRIEVWSGFSLDNELHVAALAAACGEFHPAVVYLDVLRKITTRDLNKADEASKMLAVLDNLRRRYGVIFRLIHHYRKSQGQRSGRGSQEISGSFVLGAWGENSIFFEPIGRTQGSVRVTANEVNASPLGRRWL